MIQGFSVVEPNDDGSFTVEYPIGIPEGENPPRIIFTFTGLERTRSSELNTLLKVWVFADPIHTWKFSGRLNILSLSSRESFARQIAKAGGAVKIPIDMALSYAIEKIIDYSTSIDESVWLGEVAPEEPKWLLEPFLADGGHNLLFGMGGSGKSYMVLRMAYSLATGVPFLDFKPSRQVKVLYLDWEDCKENFAHRLNMISSAPNLKEYNVPLDTFMFGIRYMRVTGGSLPSIIKLIDELVKKHDIGFVVLDSAVSACGGEPEKANVVGDYFNNLSTLRIPTLTIAHITKEENQRYPFGSTFWHNFPRNIWNFQAEHDDGSPLFKVGLFHRKSNNGPIFPAVSLQMTIENRMAEIKSSSILDWEDQLGTKSRVLCALSREPMTYKSLFSELSDVKESAVRKCVERLLKTTYLVNDSGLIRFTSEQEKLKRRMPKSE